MSEEPARLEKTRALFSKTLDAFARHPFHHHRFFGGGHAQTLAAFAWPRKHRFKSVRDEERIFETAPDVKVLGHCRWQPERLAHPTLIIWHGIEGSSASTYMFGTAEKAFRAGFNVIRMNLRTCGGTEHLTPTIYHGGLTDDLREVVKQLIEVDKLKQVLLAGFSLGGNMVLKLSGEYGDQPPPEVLAVVAVSPSIDLAASAELILKRSNWLYHRDFVYRLKKRVRTKRRLFPDRYDTRGLWKVWTLREFDDKFTSGAHGFTGADDYYHKASSIRVIDRIRIPTMIIHAQDDPFIPFAPLTDPLVTNNPYILLVGPERGGHVAFVSDDPAETANPSAPADHSGLSTQDDSGLLTQDSPLFDRFWAENRLVEFCKLARDIE
ncbi:MAG TPA: alpha/beta fold hydrolase [Pyrinomonadaceae bacterium]|nr:alpha/beta fold hydrolase [Pyrinomonadaceae bacterium]